MVSFVCCLLVFAIFGLSNAAPQFAHPQRRVKPFTIHQVSSSITNHKSGHSQFYKSLNKFNASSEKLEVVSKAAQNAQPGSVTATPYTYDAEYTSPLTIGSQTFDVTLDTGSSDLWVLGSQLRRHGSPSHTYYQPGSTAVRLEGENWEILYGDGTGAAGIVYNDTVALGETSITSQAVEVATGASAEFLSPYEPADGVLGLGFDNENTVTPNPVLGFFTDAILQGLPLAVFTAILRHDAPGTYTFGSLPSTTTPITYTPIDSSNGYWSFTPTGYSISLSGTSSSSDLAITTPTDPSVLTGIADTGTTLMILDPSVTSAYYAQVENASEVDGSYIFPCDAALPDFVLVINGYNAVVPGSFINYAPNGDGTCYGGIQSNAESSMTFSIYGDVFLKSQVVVFDRSQTSSPRIGFAPQS